MNLSFDHYDSIANENTLQKEMKAYEDAAEIHDQYCQKRLNMLLFERFINSQKTKNLKTAIYILCYRPKWLFHRRRKQDNIKFFLNYYFRKKVV